WRAKGRALVSSVHMVRRQWHIARGTHAHGYTGTPSAAQDNAGTGSSYSHTQPHATAPWTCHSQAAHASYHGGGATRSRAGSANTGSSGASYGRPCWAAAAAGL